MDNFVLRQVANLKKPRNETSISVFVSNRESNVVRGQKTY